MRLKAATTTLSRAAYSSTPWTDSGQPRPSPHAPAAARTAARASDTAGPEAATRNSWPGELGRPPTSETPPSSHKVIPSTSKPCRRATRAWASSCRTTDPKRMPVATIAMSPCPSPPTPG